MTSTRTSPGFSAEMWAAFWAAPNTSLGMDILADDIVGYWPCEPEPVRGLPAYRAKIEELIAAYPDLRLALVDSATVPGSQPDEELVYLHYVGRATGPQGPLQFRGLDRVLSRNGIVVENVIRYDPTELPL